MKVAQFILRNGTLIRKNGVLRMKTPEVLSLFNHGKPEHTGSGHVEETVLLGMTSTGEPFRGDGPIGTEVAAGESGFAHGVSCV